MKADPCLKRGYAEPMLFSRKGMTLVEVMLAAVLIGVVGLGMVMVTGTSHNFLMQTVGMATTQGEASYGHAHLKKFVGLGNRLIQYGAVGNVSSKIAVRYDHRSISGGTATPLDPTDDWWDYYGYDSGAQILYYRRDFVPGASVADPGDPGFGGEIIARNVASFTFTLVSPAQLDISMTVTKTVGTQTRTSTVVSTVSPRGMVTN